MKTILNFFLIFSFLFQITSTTYAENYQEYKNSLEIKYKAVNSYDFWVKHVKNIDKIILTHKQIKKLNTQIAMFKESTNILSAEYAPEIIKDKIIIMYKYVFNKNKFFENGKLISKNFKKRVFKKLNLVRIKAGKENKRYFGIIKNRCFIKAVPVDVKIIRDLNSLNFDRNIETVAHIFDQVRILNVSKDAKWFYVVSKYFFGWVKRENVVVRENLFKFSNFIVILKNIKKFDLKIGDILPVENNKIYIFDKKINISNLSNDDYSFGFLPFTRRNILKLVINNLFLPYSWGGDAKGIDCSLLIMDIFRCFGIVLPRNSYKQADVLPGFSLVHVKNKEEFIKKFASPLTTFIYKGGHIMLYLGSYNGKPYIAHAFTMKKYQKGEVLITDLHFGRKNFVESLKKIVFLDK